MHFIVLGLGSIVGWEWLNKPDGESDLSAGAKYFKWAVVAGGLFMGFRVAKKKRWL